MQQFRRKLINFHAHPHVAYVDLNCKIIIPPFEVEGGEPHPFTKGFSYYEVFRLVANNKDWNFQFFYIDKKGRQFLEK